MTTRLPALAVCLLVLAACGARTGLRVRGVDAGPTFDVPRVTDDVPFPDVPPPPDITEPQYATLLPGRALDEVDLLVLVDNSNSMRENQEILVAQLQPLIDTLTRPPDLNGDGVPDYLAVRSLHAAVVDTDLGTPGSSIPGCLEPDIGDDGLLNPIRNGRAESHHEPWTAAPPGFRPADCIDPNQFPSFITFESGATDATRFGHDFVCNAALYVHGCGLESPLEAIYRSLVTHDASDTAGNTSPNAGFVRTGALLAIVVLTDEEDGSVRDCRYAESGQPCADATDAYNPASTDWASMELNLRMYMYQPGGPQDPTWSLDRYVSPSDPSRGYLSLKPGHPERVFFAAVTGVPLRVPLSPDGATDWDALLGRPAPGAPNDFARRDTTTALQGNSREGPFSMLQANRDPNCAQRVVPACRREGTNYNPTACTADLQYFAWPSRRVVEIARRFDQSPWCSGRPCRNGLVSSICARDFSPTFAALRDRLLTHLPPERCIPATLRVDTNPATGLHEVACAMRELEPPNMPCDRARGRTDLLDAAGVPAFTPTPEGPRAFCLIAQIGTDAAGEPGRGLGWFYDTRTPECPHRASYTTGAQPVAGADVELVCSNSAVRP